jgi:hypothetical protein
VPKIEIFKKWKRVSRNQIGCMVWWHVI